jgi:hypothetical protein
MLKTMRGSGAAALLAVVGLAWIPLPAFAQLCIPGLTCPTPDNTPPTVRITSPASGATVSGTITVTATASDNRGVAGVQFFLDGVLGADDTAAPYSISWNTATAGNGSHTLTAVARDAAGNRTTSDPVTIAVTDTPPPPPAGRFEETDASVSYGFGWNPRDDDFRGTGWYAWSGGAAAESMTPGAQATFTFTGTSVTWLGMRSLDSGIARVYVDGVFVSEVDMFARSTELHVPVFTVSGLPAGSHTLTIEATGMKNSDPQAASSPLALVVVDAFDVPAQVVSQLQDTDPDLIFTGGWTRGDNSKPWSGWFAAFSAAPGARATLPFIGTSISWIGYRGPNAGIAGVYVDGSFAGEVDLYSPDEHVQAVLFTSPPLADANHTLAIEATGRKNAQSTGTRVVVDAFVVTTLGRRFEETDPSIAYAGSWDQGNFNRPWSMRTVTVSGEPGAQATFTFSGTSVSWIGTRKSTTGIARVYLDGAFVTEIDTYSPTDGIQDTIFRTSSLAAGTHTLTIEVTGRRNAASASAYIVVDAFDARP